MKRTFVCTCFLSFLMPAAAQGVSVQNEISVRASTGGNTAANVQEGKSTAEVFMKTTVDGKVVQEVREKMQESTEEKQQQGVEQTNEKQIEEAKPFLTKVLAFFRGIFAKWFS